MAGMGVPWVPVRNYGCGWIDCPQCGPKVEEEIETEHRKRVAATYPNRTQAEQVSDFMGELSGTTAPRDQVITPDERRKTRIDQAEGRELVRVRRSLSAEDTQLAFDRIERTNPRRAYLRQGPRDLEPTADEWKCEVWVELLNPSALSARRDSSLNIKSKVDRAIQRAQKNMKKAAKPSGASLEASGVQ